jgi:DNA (cytosine-5)-methyltransferase 1
MVTAVSVFSGIGGTELAFLSEGVELVALCEKDPWCQDNLRKNFPDTTIHGDIKDLNGTQYEGVDILITTPPCQPVSVAGSRKGGDDERWLWEESLRIVREAKPFCVFGENVKGLLTKGIEGITSDLEREGYEVRTYLLAASSVGAIHQRERVFIVGFKTERQVPYSSSIRCNGGKRATSYAQTDERAEERENQTQCTERCSSVRTVLPFRDQDKQWTTIPLVRGVDDGFPTKLDKDDKQRIKALGNSVVPQQAQPFAKGIVDYIRSMNS